MKKINIAKIIWITALFLELIVILIMIIDYKVNYQYLTNNKLYFYECDGDLCVTEVKDDEHLLFSTYECGENNCPIYKKNIEDTYVILNDNNNNILFDYRNNIKISEGYKDYQIINNNYIIVSKQNYKGIINRNNNLVVPLQYEEIGITKEDYLTGYNLNDIIVKKDNKYGIISFKTGIVIETIEHPEEDIDSLLIMIKNENYSNDIIS